MEAYHAGAIRTLLFQQAGTMVSPYGVNASTITGVRSGCDTFLLFEVYNLTLT